MARITVNTDGTNPTVLISTDITNGNIVTANIAADTLKVICLQDLTITSSTGVYSYVDFCNKDVNKLTTPADNEVAMNIVIDADTYFGLGAGSEADDKGIAGLSQDKTRVQFLVLWNYSGANLANVTGNAISNTIVGNNVGWTSGYGYITNLAPTAAVDAPVWVTPCTIAVDGTMYNGLT